MERMRKTVICLVMEMGGFYGRCLISTRVAIFCASLKTRLLVVDDLEAYREQGRDRIGLPRSGVLKQDVDDTDERRRILKNQLSKLFEVDQFLSARG